MTGFHNDIARMPLLKNASPSLLKTNKQTKKSRSIPLEGLQQFVQNKRHTSMFVYVGNSPEKCFPVAYLSGANQNITIRQKAWQSQLELGFNWTALIGLLHFEVKFNMAAKFCSEVTIWDLKWNSSREFLEIFSLPQHDTYSVLLTVLVWMHRSCGIY